jgi:dephospho-CoA kinase
MKVIGFCGLPGSGKSTALIAVEDLGTIITMGDVIRKEAINKNIEPNNENLGIIAKELRERGGDAIVAEKSVEMIKTHKNKVVFVDGIRSLSEIDVFRKYWKFPVVAIEISDELRHKRIKKRARSDDSKNLIEFMKRDKRELGFGLKEVINKANYKIMNDSSEEKLKKITREIVLEIIQNY